MRLNLMDSEPALPKYYQRENLICYIVLQIYGTPYDLNIIQQQQE